MNLRKYLTRFLIIQLAILSTLTGSLVYDLSTSKVDPELKPYLEEFKEIAFEHGVIINDSNMNFVFADTEENILGQCIIWNYGKRAVQISRRDWALLNNPEARYWIVFHELGHCLLSLDHQEGYIHKDGLLLPKTMMVPTLPLDYKFLWKNYKNYYLDQLFSLKPNF